jgi:hypothetical protein
VTVLIPGLRLVSEANQRGMSKGARFAQASRFKKQRRTVAGWLRTVQRPDPAGLVVTITRVAPRQLDSDNAVGSAKAVRDEIALWLGVNDGPTGPVTWRVEQRKGAPGAYAVEIAFTQEAA